MDKTLILAILFVIGFALTSLITMATNGTLGFIFAVAYFIFVIAPQAVRG